MTSTRACTRTHTPDFGTACGLIPAHADPSDEDFLARLGAALQDGYGTDCSPRTIHRLIGAAQQACRDCQDAATTSIARDPLLITMLLIYTNDVHLSLTGYQLPYLIGGQGGLHGTALINAGSYAARQCWQSTARSDHTAPGRQGLYTLRDKAINHAWARGVLEHAHALSARERGDVTEALLDMITGMLFAPELSRALLGGAVPHSSAYNESHAGFRAAQIAVTRALHARMNASA